MKVVILDGVCENPGDLSWQGFEKFGELTVYDRTPDDAQIVISRIADNAAVIVNKVSITREIIEACPSIEYIGVLATGYNIVDTEAAAEKGIPVCNIPTYGTAAVAQHVFALLLETCQHVGHHNKVVKEGKWTACEDFCFWDYPLTELNGKTIGIIGFGRIGQKVAEIAKAFNMSVLAYDKQVPLTETEAEFVTLTELYERADIISLHCPLFDDTREIINKNSLEYMRDGVIIINTSRGGLINENDLKCALDSGKVSYAAVDVVSSEPIRADNPLLSCENCIITPHIAWAPRESRQRLMDVAVANLQCFLDGEPIHVVNFK